MSWVEVDGAGWRWMEKGGAGWSWVHVLVIPIENWNKISTNSNVTRLQRVDQTEPRREIE